VTPSDEVEELRRKIQEQRRECEQVVSQIQNESIEFWRQQVGPAADVMLEDRKEAMRCLQHPSSSVRCAALSALGRKWKAQSDPKFVNSCERLALLDPDDEVRAYALTLLGSCYANTSDSRVGNLLAKQITNMAVPTSVKIAAYMGLLVLCGQFNNQYNKFLKFQFPDQIDWTLVKQFIQHNPPPKPALQEEIFPPTLSENERLGFVAFQQGCRAFEAGEYNQAISLLTEAIERLPGGVGAYRTRGRAYVMTGQLAESIADFTRAIELNPKDAQLFRERAVAYMKSGLVDEATLDERTANRLDGKAD
jgi:tetratricopeptide (TPR) repeat protein